jgi:hypothetical protein
MESSLRVAAICAEGAIFHMGRFHGPVDPETRADADPLRDEGQIAEPVQVREEPHGRTPGVWS